MTYENVGLYLYALYSNTFYRNLHNIQTLHYISAEMMMLEKNMFCGIFVSGYEAFHDDKFFL